MSTAATEGVTRTATVLVPHMSSSVALVRGRLARDLAAREVTPAVVDDAVLVASELVSNALKHARPLDSGKIQVAWAVAGESVDVAVTDGGSPTRPLVTHPPISALGGRGLGIVERLSSRWGVQEDGDAFTVWAAVPLAGRPARRP